MSEIDLLVVGGGTAGLVGGQTAAMLGARTTLVERARTGGDCLWTGCVPSKTLRDVASELRVQRPARADFGEVSARIADAIRTIEPVDSPEALRKAGVAVRQGTLRFVAPGVAEVDGETLRFRQALLATGAAPAVPPIDGLQGVPYVTTETIWNLDQVPRRLAVIGGGPAGCELGQAFARLGSEVTIVAGSRLLPREDRDAVAALTRSLERDGVSIRTGAAVTRVRTADGGIRLELTDGRTFEADTVLVATGRRPRSADLGLQRLGVDVDQSGAVIVDRQRRTTHPRIWAAGDVTGPPYYTHLAGMHASIAASNAVLGIGRSISPVMPRVTFTAPELAAVGLTSKRRAHQTVVTNRHEHVDRAITDGETDGLTRLVLGRRDRILGGTIVSPRAGETLGELTLAVAKGLTTSDLADVPHAYPTYSDGFWNASVDRYRSSLRRPPLALALRLLRRVQGWRVG